jgi:pyridoxine 4-dehydrogenase
MTYSTPLHATYFAVAFLMFSSRSSEAFGVTKARTKAQVIKKNPSSLVDTTKIGSITVPTVGTGTISWSSNSLFSTENKEVEELIKEAYLSDAAFFDTAERYGSHFKTAVGMGYGETERMTSMYLEKARLDGGSSLVKPVVATKFTPVPWRNTVQSVVDACEQSCKNLGVDQIDLYQIHMPDIVQPFRAFGKVDTKDTIYWEGLAECYNRGLVKNVGVCNYGPTLVEKCHDALAKKGVPLASNQISFSLLGRHNGSQETIDKCNKLGVKVLAYYPFAMGLLTGKYSNDLLTENDAGSGDLSLTQKKKTNLELADLERYAYGDGVMVPEGGIQPLLKTMTTIAKRRKKTLSQVALNYIISKGAIPIPGCRTVQQLEDNLGAMGWRLSPTEVKMLELEADKLGFGFDGAGFKRTNEKFVGYGVEKWSLD